MAETQTFQLPENVTNARQNAQDLTSVAQQYQAAEPTVSDVLRQKVQEAYAQNQDIIKPLDIATSTYLSAPSVAREKYLTPGSPNAVTNPFAAERLVSEYTNQAAVPMLGYGSILGQRQGRIQDLIGTGVNAYTAATTAAQAKAQNARALYEDSLNEYLQLQQLDLRQQEINKPSGGSGVNINLGGLDLSKLNKGGTSYLTDPTTGQIYEYDGITDPDYVEDWNKWYGPNQSKPFDYSQAKSISFDYSQARSIPK